MKKLYTFGFAVLFFHLSLSSQNITITATGGSTTASYPTLKSTLEAINKGTHQGNIIVQIHKNITETANCLLDSSGNATNSSYSSITLRPADTATVNKTITLGVGGVTLLTLRGADNVNFDGRPAGTGPNNLLTFSHISQAAASHTVEFEAGASFNSFRYCNIANASTGNVASSTVRLLTGRNSGNTFSHSILSGGQFGVEINGSNAAPNNNTSILFSQLVNQKVSSIRLFAGVGNVNIDSNRFYHTINNTALGYQGMRIDIIDSLSTVTFNRNRIYNVRMPLAAPGAIHGIAFNPTGTNGRLVVRNNSFVLGSNTVPNLATQFIRGIYFYGAGSATVIIESNTIRIGGSQTTSTMQPTTIGMLKENTSGGSVFVFRNNLCINTRSGTEYEHLGCFMSTATTGTNDIDFNTYYGGPQYVVAWLNAVYNDLAAYKAAANPLEQNSSFGVLDFVDEINPDLQSPSANNIYTLLRAKPSVAVPSDIYGTARSLTDPYKGAFEGPSISATHVQLFSFRGSERGEDVELAWETATEIHNLGYQVERSSDGVTFTPLAFVDGGKQGTGTHSYKFTDTAAFLKTSASILFYRLKLVDINNNFKYSQTITVAKTKFNYITAYPNPLSSQLNLNIKSKTSTPAIIDIMDINGRKLISLKRMVTTGENKIIVNETAGLVAGIYFVKINLADEITVLKLIKLN